VPRSVLPDREAVPRTRLPGTDQLSASARHEVEAMNAAWGREWERAVTCADKALEQLAGGKEIRRYQALWNYLAGSWAIAGRADTAEQAPEEHHHQDQTLTAK
jgi:hypothetical protein